MDRYLKLISWTALISGLLVIVIIMGALIIERQKYPLKVAIPAPAYNIPIPPNANEDISDRPLVGLINKVEQNKLWLQHAGQNLEINLDPNLTTVVKTTKPIPIPPNSKMKIQPITRTTVPTAYLQPGQEVKITTLPSASTNTLLATSLEVWQ